MSVTALIRATDSLKKREGDLSPTLKTIFFEGLKNKYEKQTIKSVLSSYKGGSWGSDYIKDSIKAKVLRSPDIRFGFIDIENAEERYFSNKEFESFSLKNNDILVIKSNGSLDLVGKSQIYKVDKKHPFVIASNFLMVLTPNQEIIYPEYLDLFLKSPESLVWRFDTQKTTTGLRNLNSTAFLNIEIPVPDSIEEQKKLYNSFQSYLKGNIPSDELEIKRFYSLSKQKEELSTELSHQLSLVKKLRQQLLQDAVQGKLVAQNKKDEPATLLLKKIKAEKEKLIAEKKIKKEKELPPIKAEEIPFKIPENWVWCRLGEITTLLTDGKHGDSTDQMNSGYYFLSAKDIQNGKFIYDNARQITYDDFLETHRRTNLEPGDLCVVNTGATIGKTALAPDNELTRNTTFQKSVAILKVVNRYTCMKFVEYFIINETPKLLKTSRGSAINNLLLGDMRNVLFPMPPLYEQNRIVKKLDELMQNCNELDASIKQSASQNEKLLQQVLREALSLPRQMRGKEPVEA